MANREDRPLTKAQFLAVHRKITAPENYIQYFPVFHEIMTSEESLIVHLALHFLKFPPKSKLDERLRKNGWVLFSTADVQGKIRFSKLKQYRTLKSLASRKLIRVERFGTKKHRYVYVDMLQIHKLIAPYK